MPITPTTTNVDLVINRVPSLDILKQMESAGQLQPNQLYTIPSEIGDGLVALQTKELWTNPNPTSSFAVQSINVEDITNYDYLYVDLIWLTTDTPLFSGLVYVTDFIQYKSQNFHAEKGSKVARLLKYTDSNTNLTWGEGNYNGETNNNAAIPIRIIGIKLITSQDGLNDYSTEEQYTGRRWVDGKKIYEKTVELNLSMSGDNWYNTTIQIPNIETIVHSDCLGVDIGYTSSMAHFGAPLVTYKTDGYLSIYNMGVHATLKYLILQYTKTTE